MQFYKRPRSYILLLIVIAIGVGIIRCSSADETPPTPSAQPQDPTATFTTQPVTSTPTPSPTTTALPSDTPSPTPTSTITPTPTTLTVTLQKLCIHQTGDLPFSRADIYFSLRLIDPSGVSHTLREVPQPKLIKQAASLNCSDPLLLGDQKRLTLRQIEGNCLRIEGEFWNANRLWTDMLVGKINEPVCYRQGKWSPLGILSRHLTGGGADWEVVFETSH